MTKFFENEAEMLAEELSIRCDSYNEALNLVEQNVDAIWESNNWSDVSATDAAAKKFFTWETVDKLKLAFA